MLDRFNREIEYLRISVTDKCNLRCRYCMPEDGVPFVSHNKLLRFEQIVKIASTAVELGIRKVRLTGGEPLVKKNIEELVHQLSEINGLETIAMTTNASLLESKANILKISGLTSINISLDTLTPDKYTYITRGGNINNVLSGINAALHEQFPLKINMVVMKNFNEDEVSSIHNFCRERGIIFQPINHFKLYSQKLDTYKFERPPRCETCNRIRLLSDGTLKPCLHSDEGFRVNFNDIRSSLIKTINAKPEKGQACTLKQMVEIGG